MLPRQWVDSAVGNKDMKEEYKKLIEEIMPGMHCSKDFKCAQSGLVEMFEG